MMEQDAVHIGYEADATAHLLDTNGKKIGVTGLLDTGAVQSVLPINTWGRKGFNNGPPHGAMGSLDELPGGRELG